MARKLPRCVWPQSVQRFGERVRLVCVVDEDRRAIALACKVEPAFGALQALQRGKHRARLAVGSDREPRSGQCILDLEATNQWQPHRVIGAGIGQLHHLREAFDRYSASAEELPKGHTRKEEEGVFVVRDGVAQFLPVKTGIAGDKYFEVLSGLKEGERVIIGPFNSVRNLADGDAVKVETPASARRP